MSLILKPSMKGFFKLEAIRPDGRRRLLADWFPNLITDVGLNRIGTGSYLTACHVGTGTATPNVLDTGLAGYVGGTTTYQADTDGAMSTPPYYGWRKITYRFGTGVAAGNLAEVGIATAATNGGGTILFSRARILDGNGNPSTVTVQSDEVLDVTYELRLYPDLADTVQAGVTITGFGVVDVTTRAAYVTNQYWGNFLGRTISFNPTGGTNGHVSNGTLGAITSGPSGTSASSSGYAYNVGSYANNSLERTGGFGFGLNYGNLSGGIKCAWFYTTLGIYQCGFSQAIPKDNTNTISFVFKVAWTRNV